MKSIKTALLSFGMSGRVFHAPFIHAHPGFQLHSVLERNRKTAASQYPGIQSYDQVELLLQDQELELVIVNTPNYTHYTYARMALEAGKHVIVEKPFTTSVKEGRELIQLAKNHGKLLSVFHNRRWDSDFKTVKEIIAENWLGDIVEAEIHFDRYKQERSPKLHKENPGPGAGVLFDLGSHIIDQALHLFGSPHAVFADIGIIRPVSQVDDYFDIRLYYPSLRVRLHSSYLVKEPVPSYIIHGTNGSFLKSRSDIQEAALQQGKLPGSTDWGKEPESEQGLLNILKDGETVRRTWPALHGNYMEYFNGIYESIVNGSPPPVTGEEGLQVIQMIETCWQSKHEQRVVKFIS